MNQVQPLVSVCIPTYNRAKKLERAVHALVGGSYKNIEIIISDNASSDETQNICSAFVASDSRVKYFRHAENQGPTKNFEFARDQATGKYFLWHGDDDYLDTDYIRTCVAELEQYPSLVLASGLGAYHNGDNTLTHYGNVIQSDSDVPFFRVMKYLSLVGDNSIFYGVFRVDLLRGIRMPNCLAGDWAWIGSVLLRGKAKVIPVVYVHRDFEGSTSSSIARIVSVIGAPRWHSRFPWIALSANVAGYLTFQSSDYKKKLLLRKIVAYILIYGTLMIKGSIMNLRIITAKLPFARKIHRKFFKKNSPE